MRLFGAIAWSCGAQPRASESALWRGRSAGLAWPILSIGQFFKGVCALKFRRPPTGLGQAGRLAACFICHFSWWPLFVVKGHNASPRLSMATFTQRCRAFTVPDWISSLLRASERLRINKLTRRQAVLGAAALAIDTAISQLACAESTWPAKPVQVIVPYPTGGGADRISRILFGKLSESLGQSFRIRNLSGPGGTYGQRAVAKSNPDGYTLLYDASAFSINPSLYSNLSFDYAKDFEPVFLAALVPNILVVTPSVPVTSVADIVAMGKNTPRGLNFASSGFGTVQHLSLEMFRLATNTKINHVPYAGGGPALKAVSAGRVKFFFSNAASSIPLVQSGRLKAIAHTGNGRLATLPELPSVKESLCWLRGLRLERGVRACRHTAVCR